MANISRFFWAAATAIASNNTPLVTIGPERGFTARLASVLSARALGHDHGLVPVCLRLEQSDYYSKLNFGLQTDQCMMTVRKNSLNSVRRAPPTPQRLSSRMRHFPRRARPSRPLWFQAHISLYPQPPQLSVGVGTLIHYQNLKNWFFILYYRLKVAGVSMCVCDGGISLHSSGSIDKVGSVGTDV